MAVRGLFAVLVLTPWTAMAQRFDVVTFEAPPDWTRQALGDGLMFESRPAGTFCQIFLRKSRKPTASLPQELDRAWSELRERQPLVAAAPDPAHLDLPSGFTIARRVGHVQTGSGPLMVMLNLLRKDDRLVTVVVNVGDTKALDRCGTAIGDFLASLRLDTTMATSGSPRSDPQLAAKFGNSVVGAWRFGGTFVDGTGTAPTQARRSIEVRFARDGTYRIATHAALPGGGTFNRAETGTYLVDGQRIRMRPAQGADTGPYDLEWFFGDEPESPGNWGLILRSSSEWPGTFGGSDPARWRAFKPAN